MVDNQCSSLNHDSLADDAVQQAQSGVGVEVDVVQTHSSPHSVVHFYNKKGDRGW